MKGWKEKGGRGKRNRKLFYFVKDKYEINI